MTTATTCTSARANLKALLDQVADRRQGGITCLKGPDDAGGSVGYFAVIREPSGHLVEFTHGQPLSGLASAGAA